MPKEEPGGEVTFGAEQGDGSDTQQSKREEHPKWGRKGKSLLQLVKKKIPEETFEFRSSSALVQVRLKSVMLPLVLLDQLLLAHLH
ncbi:uncharacterized [Tachysurus ichikawai]